MEKLKNRKDKKNLPKLTQLSPVDQGHSFWVHVLNNFYMDLKTVIYKALFKHKILLILLSTPF